MFVGGVAIWPFCCSLMEGINIISISLLLFTDLSGTYGGIPACRGNQYMSCSFGIIIIIFWLSVALVLICQYYVLIY